MTPDQYFLVNGLDMQSAGGSVVRIAADSPVEIDATSDHKHMIATYGGRKEIFRAVISLGDVYQVRSSSMRRVLKSRHMNLLSGRNT